MDIKLNLSEKLGNQINNYTLKKYTCLLIYDKHQEKNNTLPFSIHQKVALL